MSGISVEIELPEDSTPGELIKGYFTLMRAFGWDLYVTSHYALKDAIGPNWYPARISSLRAARPEAWRPNFRYDPQDPGVILRDYAHEYDSPYTAVFGGELAKRSAAKKILSTRNTWFHFGEDPTLSQLVEAAKTVRSFVSGGGLHIGKRIDALIVRIEALSTGRYPELSEAAPTAPLPEPRMPETIETPTDLPRPSIGGTWIGDIPTLRYRLTKTGDLVDPTTMASVSERVPGDFATKLRLWTAVEPRGREVWIDTDGAVGGFIGPSPRLLGYLGEDPAQDVARGFFIPHFYAVEAGEIVDLDSGERFASPLVASVPEGASLRVTTYGDVLVVDSEGYERIATVVPNQWFPGHLG
jgi:hypothetical protein